MQRTGADERARPSVPRDPTHVFSGLPPGGPNWAPRLATPGARPPAGLPCPGGPREEMARGYRDFLTWGDPQEKRWDQRSCEGRHTTQEKVRAMLMTISYRLAFGLIPQGRLLTEVNSSTQALQKGGLPV